MKLQATCSLLGWGLVLGCWITSVGLIVLARAEQASSAETKCYELGKTRCSLCGLPGPSCEDSPCVNHGLWFSCDTPYGWKRPVAETYEVPGCEIVSSGREGCTVEGGVTVWCIQSAACDPDSPCARDPQRNNGRFCRAKEPYTGTCGIVEAHLTGGACP